MDTTTDPFEAQPHFAERLRAHFEPVATLDADCRAQLEHEAGALLTTLLAIEESTAARTNTDDEAEAGPDLLRLERKLDLVLELLSARLLGADAPEERSVQMSAAGARWPVGPSAPRPAVGSRGIVSIHLHRLLPRALRLPAEVLPDAAGWLSLRFLDVGEVCRELLVRHVFQQHRRHLAGARRAQRDS